METIINIEHLAKEHYKGQLLKDVNLAKYNTWHVGGKADYVYKPNSISDLQTFIRVITKNTQNIKFYFWV